MSTDKESTVTITKLEYDELIEDRKFLNALRMAGVDNWEGYDYALEILGEHNHKKVSK